MLSIIEGTVKINKSKFRKYLDQCDPLLCQRLRPFIKRGLVSHIPNRWQVLQGEWEMAPYVIFPDIDDKERYEGAVFGNPLLRTPLILMYIGLDHFRIGTGLGASKVSLIRHLNIVHHQVMPDWDLQILQFFPDGLDDLRRYTRGLDTRRVSSKIELHRQWIDKIIPNAREYRQELLRKDGWIDKAERMNYTTDDQIPAHLRSEFFSFVRFLNWCLTLPTSCPTWKCPGILLQHLFTRWKTKH